MGDLDKNEGFFFAHFPIFLMLCLVSEKYQEKKNVKENNFFMFGCCIKKLYKINIY